MTTPQSYDARIGALVQSCRKAQGISQRQLAHQVDLHAAAMSRYESGSRKWPVRKLADVADALGVPLADLVPGEGSVEREAV